METDELLAYVSALAELAKNDQAWTYTIHGFDGSPYITRTLLPRIGERRMLLHQIHREDADPHHHNHPWRTARFLILSGGYVEERLTGGQCRREDASAGRLERDQRGHLPSRAHRVAEHLDARDRRRALPGVGLPDRRRARAECGVLRAARLQERGRHLVICATCQRHRALANSDHCLKCWRAWWVGVDLIARIKATPLGKCRAR